VTSVLEHALVVEDEPFQRERVRGWLKTKFVRPDGAIGAQPGHGIVLVGAGETACEALLGAAERKFGMVWDRRGVKRKERT
jgi:hypothetical protein